MRPHERNFSPGANSDKNVHENDADEKDAVHDRYWLSICIGFFMLYWIIIISQLLRLLRLYINCESV